MSELPRELAALAEAGALAPGLQLAGAWLLAYLLHSTILLTIALLLNGLARGLNDSTRELMLRFALFGGIASATASMLLPPPAAEVSGWRHSFGSVPAADSAGESARGEAASVPMLADGAVNHGFVDAPPAAAHSPLKPVEPLSTGLISPADLAPRGWPLLLMVIALSLGGALAVRNIVLSHARLRHALRQRKPLPADSAAARQLKGLLDRSGLRFRRAIGLSASDHLEVPIAMGILRPEICLPLRRLPQLDDAQVGLMLAHELAHLARRDPLWQLVYRLLESTLFLQPLNICARRALRTIAEYQCDAWAAGVCGQPARLARVLADVAEWLVAGRKNDELLAPAASMAERRSAIRSRIERLLADPPARPQRRRGPIRRGLAALASVAIIAALAGASPQFRPRPAVTSDADTSTSAPSGPEDAAPSVPDLAPAPLTEVLASLDDQLALLETEADLLGARARNAGADAETLALLKDILDRIALVRAARAELALAVDASDGARIQSGSRIQTPDATPLMTGRRSP